MGEPVRTECEIATVFTAELGVVEVLPTAGGVSDDARGRDFENLTLKFNGRQRSYPVVCEALPGSPATSVASVSKFWPYVDILGEQNHVKKMWLEYLDVWIKSS